MRLQGNSTRSFRLALGCTLLMLFTPVAAQVVTENAGELIVEETTGAAKIKMENRWQSPATGMIVSLPATVSTGADGSVRIRQDSTVISIAANTAIELFAGTEPGVPLQRVVQNQGSAFYDIAPRESSRLRVETPYLVAVIKGTEFNVTVAAETSTVALFEGRLQIEAPDVGDVVDLHQGQIAKRHKDDAGITVLAMDSAEPVTGVVSPAGGDDSNAANDPVDDLDSGFGGGRSDRVDVRDGDAVPAGSGREPTGEAGDAPYFSPDELLAGLDGALDIGNGDDSALQADIELDNLDMRTVFETGLDIASDSLDLEVDAGLDLAAVELDVALDTSLDLGDAAADLGLDVGVDLGDGSIDLGLDTGLDVADAALDVGLDTGADLDSGDIGLGLDAGIDTGGSLADIGVDAGADLDQGDIGLELDGDLDVGGALADSGLDAGLEIGADTGLDAGTGGLDAGIDAGADLSVAGADVGVDVGVSLDLGSLGDLTDIADVDLDVDLDLFDDEDSDDDDDSLNLPVDPGHLLDLLKL